VIADRGHGLGLVGALGGTVTVLVVLGGAVGVGVVAQGRDRTSYGARRAAVASSFWEAQSAMSPAAASTGSPSLLGLEP
jgi:hypothetical protein